jgi:hypothetical protein
MQVDLTDRPTLNHSVVGTKGLQAKMTHAFLSSPHGLGDRDSRQVYGLIYQISETGNRGADEI